MSFIRSTTNFTRNLRAPLTSTSRPFTTTILRAAQGYGDAEGDPKGSNPEQQGASNNTKTNLEHPGPDAPSEGQGTGGATKAGKSSSQSSPSDASAQSGGARSKEAKETGSSPTGGSVGGKREFSTSTRRGFGMSARMRKEQETPSNGAKPKIHATSKPGEKLSPEKQKEVDQHNKEFDQKHDKARDGEKDHKN